MRCKDKFSNVSLYVFSCLLMIVNICTVLYWWIRPMLKWIIRKTTGKCELLRITLTATHKYDRASQIGMHVTIVFTFDGVYFKMFFGIHIKLELGVAIFYILDFTS